MSEVKKNVYTEEISCVRRRIKSWTNGKHLNDKQNWVHVFFSVTWSGVLRRRYDNARTVEQGNTPNSLLVDHDLVLLLLFTLVGIYHWSV